jgi:hypothetical protein
MMLMVARATKGAGIMRRLVLAGLGLVVLTAAGASAQDRPLDETLAYVNGALEQHSYVDHDGQPTVSQVKLEKGILVVEVTKTKSGNKFTNVYEVGLDDLDITRVKANNRGGFTAISLGAKGDVGVRLVCTMANGIVHGWDLPDTKEISVELAPDVPEVRELTRALVDLIAQARKDARYAPA